MSSSDGVPNRKGGSWPNHPAMRYELPIPFSPGADNVTDAYRAGWDRIFGPKACQGCSAFAVSGHKQGCPEFKTYDQCVAEVQAQVDAARVQECSPVQCEVCGDPGYHRLEAGVFTCEIES